MKRSVYSWTVTIGYTLLPILLTFGASQTSYESLFRPPPSNPFYDGMLVTICVSLGISEIFLTRFAWNEIKEMNSRNALVGFEIGLAFVLGITNLIAGAYASGSLWLVFFLTLALVFGLITKETKGSRLLSTPLGPTCSYVQRKRSILVWIYSSFLLILAIGFLAFPVSRPWSGPPEPFIRWHPYSVPGEYIWRGVFFTYAWNMIWTALEDPAGKHSPFVLYLGTSCFLHATAMLIMNLVERSKGMPNGNVEHSLSEIPGFYFIGIFSLIIYRKSRVVGSSNEFS